MKISKSYFEIASDWQLWREYADPDGQREDFDKMSMEYKTDLLQRCFGDEDAEDEGWASN